MEEAEALVAKYEAGYTVAAEKTDYTVTRPTKSAMKKMPDAEGCIAFTDTFQELYGMEQPPH